jgi:MFS family permease
VHGRQRNGTRATAHPRKSGRITSRLPSTRSPVAALAATTTAGYGVLFYAYGVLLVPMDEDLGWGRPFLSGAFSAALVCSALLTVPVGHWLDRHPPRDLFVAGAVASTALVVAWSMATSRVAFVAVWVLLGGGQAVLFYEPAFTVLTKWFGGRERQRAITTVTLVAGLASTIFGPLTGYLERQLGWRGAVAVLAGVLGAVTVPSFALGLGAGPPAPESAAGGVPGVGGSEVAEDSLPSDAYRSRSFWMLTAAYLLNAATTFAIAVHLVAFLTGRGISTPTAAAVLGAVGLVQVLGRGTFVRLGATRPALHLATGVLAAKAVGVLLLLALPGLAGVASFVVVYGAANGVSTLTRALTIGEVYGPTHYGAISSSVASVSALGGAVAPFAAAAAIELIGGDRPVFFGLALLLLVAAGANELVARPSRAR